MSCIKSGGCVTLIVINVIFLLTALGLITLGVIILQGHTTVFKKHIDSTVDDIQRDVAITFGQVIPKDLGLLYKVYSNFGIGLTISGSILLILSAVGLLGGSCKWPNILFVYAFVVGFLIVAQIVFICLVFFQRDKIRNAVKKPMKDLIKNYEGSNGTSEESWAWNFIMRKHECCGIDDYTDFVKYSSKWWGRTEHLTPYMCCINFPNNNAEGDACTGASNTASLSTIAGKNYYDKGCLDAVWDTLVTENAGFLITGGFVLFVCQFLVVIFSCILYCGKDDEDEDDQIGRGNRVHPYDGRTFRRQPSRNNSIVSPRTEMSIEDLE